MDPDPHSSSLISLQLAGDAAYTLSPEVFLIEFVIFLILLGLSAFFSGSEVAFFSIDEGSRRELQSDADKRNRLVAQLLTAPRQLLITILIANTLANVGAAILAAVMTLQVAMHFGLNHTLVLIVEVIVLTFVLLVISEISPKLIATRQSIKYSRVAAPVLRTLYAFLGPVARLLARATEAIQNNLKPANNRLSSEDVKVMADVGKAEGTLEENERELIYSIVEFGNTSVREIMVSRLDIIALSVNATFAEALQEIRTNGHSRIPIFREHLDNILGILYAKDLLPLIGNGEPQDVEWARLVRPAMFVPLGKKLDDLLRDFQTKKTHIAIVVDEYGGTAGLVTLEDVLEEIVGDIRDEHDEDEAMFEKLGENLYRFDARIDLDEMVELLDIDWDTAAFEFETLGGLIYHLLGYIPSAGEQVSLPPLNMKVQSVEAHRILDVLVKVEPLPGGETEETEEQPGGAEAEKREK